MKNKLGTLYIVSAPSGTGKTSLVKGLLATLTNIKVSVSHATRAMRPGEVEGRNYYFITRETFDGMVQKNDFLEHADVYGNLYGTSKCWVENELKQGHDVVLEIEWQGAKQVREKFPQAVSIFILPPNAKALEERLTSRGQDKDEVIQYRLSAAKKEVQYCIDYDYIVVNDQFEVALSDLRSIIRAEHCRQKKQMQQQAELIKTLAG